MAFLVSTKAWGKQKKEGEETDSLSGLTGWS